MLEIIEPIILEVYGDTEFARSLATHLAQSLTVPERWERTREDTIRVICWNWFSGGSTAQYVAERIDGALKDAGL